MEQSALPGLGGGADPSVGMSPARLARLDEVMQRRYVDSGCLLFCPRRLAGY
jgi:hypothetical protein